MKDEVDISTRQLFKLFPDQEAARQYLEGRLWPNGVRCPKCSSPDRITARKDGFYRCNPCKLDFTIRTGTILERSHVPLHKWIYAMHLLVASRQGISSMQLSKDIGITQKSAWFVLRRLREACGNDLTVLRGIVESDETYLGGKARKRPRGKKSRAERHSSGKAGAADIRKHSSRAQVHRIVSKELVIVPQVLQLHIEVA